MSMNDEELEELLPLYALGALNKDEQAQVNAYLARNPAARKRLAEFKETTEALAFAAPPTQPAPRVKQALMARVTKDALRREPAPSPGILSLLGGLLRTLSPVLAVASFAAVLAAGVWGMSLNNQIASLSAQTQALQTQLSTQREIVAELAAPAQQVIAIAGTDSQPGAHGHLVTHDDGSAVLVVSGLDNLDPNRIYQLWMSRGDTPISAGLFEVGDDGVGILKVAMADSANTFNAVGISVEPAGGSALPTGDIVMLGQIS
jgi:anti-sigma-K factor RskA